MTSLDKLLYEASNGNFPPVEGGIDIDTLRLTDKQIDGITIVTDDDGKIKVADDFVMNDIEISDVADLQNKLDDTKTYTDNEIATLSGEIEDNFTKIGHVHQIADINGLQALLDGNAQLPISADDVNETTTKQFIDGSLKAQITSNTTEVSSFGERINELEDLINNTSSTDEKVKMNATDATAGYLEDKIDNTTLVSFNDKVVVKGIDGLTATIQELNLLTGSTSNIQAQIDALTSVGNFTTTVNTYTDLANLAPNTNDMVIVLEDENHADATSIYIFNGVDWIYSGEFKGGEIRNFTTNPLNLETETTGVLQKDKYEKQNAVETPLGDTGGLLSSANVKDAIVELFQFADSGKRAIANAIGSPVSSSDDFTTIAYKYQSLVENITNAITAKGVPAYSYNKLNELPAKIFAIPNTSIEGGLKKTSKLNITAPYTYEIELDEFFPISDVATSIIEFVQGDVGVLHYDVQFDNADMNKFIPNDNILFDGKMQLNNKSENFSAVKDDSWVGDGTLSRVSLNRDDWNSVDKLEISSK